MPVLSGMQHAIEITSRSGSLTAEERALIVETLGELITRFPGARCQVTVVKRSAAERRISWSLETGVSLPGRLVAVHQPAGPTLGSVLWETANALRRRLEGSARGSSW